MVGSGGGKRALADLSVDPFGKADGVTTTTAIGTSLQRAAGATEFARQSVVLFLRRRRSSPLVDCVARLCEETPVDDSKCHARRILDIVAGPCSMVGASVRKHGSRSSHGQPLMPVLAR